MVVIAIIAILASLLLPILGQAKAAAHRTVCRNNLRQQGIATTMYVGDFGAYPLYNTPAYPLPDRPGELGWDMWLDLLEPYLGDRWPQDNWPGKGTPPPARTGVFACPGYNRIGGIYKKYTQGATGAYAYHATGSHMFTGGSADNFVGTSGLAGGTSLTEPSPVREGEITNPSEMIAIGDSQIIVADGRPPEHITGQVHFPVPISLLRRLFPSPKSVLPPSPLLPGELGMLNRHTGQWGMVFCDGHVEMAKLARFWDFRRDDVARKWNRDNQPHRGRPGI